MSYCRTCGPEVGENAMACTGCGVKPNDGNKFCPSCGKETNEKAVMCVGCGVGFKTENKLGLGDISVGNSGGEPNPNPVGGGTAFLWWLCCLPVGYAQWGQLGKGFVWILISIITGGFGGFVAWVDYAMCFQAQKKRKLSEWEFFPSA